MTYEELKDEILAKYPVREWKDSPSFNAYIDWWYSEHSDTLSREALLEKAEKWYNSARSKKESALHNLEAKLESFKKDTFTRTNHPFWSQLFWQDFNIEIFYKTNLGLDIYRRDIIPLI